MSFKTYACSIYGEIKTFSTATFNSLDKCKDFKLILLLFMENITLNIRED